MKPLTKTTIRSPEPPPDELERIWQTAIQIPLPRDYMRGMNSDPLVIPERPLLFRRESLSDLATEPKGHHHRFVLLFAARGSGSVCVDGHVIHLAKGMALLVFPFQFHHYLSNGRSSIRWVYVTFESNDAACLEPLRNQPRLLRPQFLLRHLLECALPKLSHPASRVAELRLWLALILRRMLSQESKPINLSLPEGDILAYEILEKVNRFLYSNIRQQLTLRQLATHCGYSESHLRSLFKRHVQLSLGAYITRVRLEKAAGLLHQNQLNITQIALACGYNSVYSFSRIFRRKFGCAPSDYRNRYDSIRGPY